MLYTIQKSENQFNLIQTPHVPGYGRAVGFLQELNKTITQENCTLTWGQKKEIENTLNHIRTHCIQKKSWLFKLQAFLNPFSNAYKIEKLMRNILSIANVKDQDLVQKAKKNQNVFSFFSPSNEGFIDAIRNTPRSKAGENLYYAYYHTREKRILFDIMRLLDDRGEVIPFIIEIDPDHSLMRILSQKEVEETSKLSNNSIKGIMTGRARDYYHFYNDITNETASGLWKCENS